MQTFCRSEPVYLAPAEVRSLLDGNSRFHMRRQNRVPVRLVLVVEQLPGRHADDAGADSLFCELFVSVEAERHFAAGADEDHFRVASGGVGEHVGAARQARGRGVFCAVDRGNRLARQDQDGRLVV